MGHLSSPKALSLTLAKLKVNKREWVRFCSNPVSGSMNIRSLMESSDCGRQCDQIRRYLKVLGNKFAYESSSKRLASFGKDAVDIIWASFLLQHLVTLVAAHKPRMIRAIFGDPLTADEVVVGLKRRGQKPGLVVRKGDFWPWSCEFESCCLILDGLFFTLIVWKLKINRTEVGNGLYQN